MALVVKKNPTYQCRRHKRCWFDPWVRKILWRRKWQTTPEFWPGKFRGHRSLASSYSPWGYKESDTTEHTIHIHITSLVLMYLLTISLYLLTTFVTIQSWYCINNDYIPHTENFIPVTHLFCNWKFAPLNFSHRSIPFPLATTCLFSVSLLLCLLIF